MRMVWRRPFPISVSAKSATMTTTTMGEPFSKAFFRTKQFCSKMISGALLWSVYGSWLLYNPIVAASKPSKRMRPMASMASTRARPLAFCSPKFSNGPTLRFDSRSVFGKTISQDQTPDIYSSNRSRRFLSSSSDSNKDTFSVESLANKLADSKFSKIIALVGAGASCSAGIPDFRTPGKGLYDKLGKYNLPVPESIFDLDYYTNVTPLPFVDLCRDIWPGQEGGPRPTPTHHFLKLLEEKGLLHRIYTQNIDGLESLAGISTEKLVECHGHFRSASCTNCGKEMPIDDCFKIMVDEREPPFCPACGSLVKPDIVFFGEEMPSRFVKLIDGDTRDCDLLLVFGTSLLVMPVAGIPSWVARDCPRVLFNLEDAGGIGSGIAKHLREDLFLQGDCDESVRTLCELAGWGNDLKTLMANY